MRHRVAVASSVLVLVSLLGFSAVQAYRSYRAGEEGIEVTAIMTKALVLVQRASVERGPTNGVLGEALPIPQDRLDALDKARTATDRAFWDARDAVAGLGDTSVIAPEVLRAYNRARNTLTERRSDVDRLAALPLDQRSAPAIQQAVSGMIAVIPQLQPAVTRIAVDATNTDPDLGDALGVAQVTAQLREMAGQLGSALTVPLATHQALTDAQLVTISSLEQQIRDLKMSLDVRIARFLPDADLSWRIQQMNDLYFTEGLSFVNALVNNGRTSGDYRVSSGMFAERYVPAMLTLFDVRDSILGIAHRHAELRMQRARSLFWALGAGAIVFAFSFLIVLAAPARRQAKKAWDNARFLDSATLVDTMGNDLVDHQDTVPSH